MNAVILEYQSFPLACDRRQSMGAAANGNLSCSMSFCTCAGVDFQLPGAEPPAGTSGKRCANTGPQGTNVPGITGRCRSRLCENEVGEFVFD
jgi:hypothetical protein